MSQKDIDEGFACDLYGSPSHSGRSLKGDIISDGKIWRRNYTTGGDLQWLWKWLPNNENNKEQLLDGITQDIKGIQGRMNTFNRAINTMKQKIQDLNKRKEIIEWTIHK